MYKNIYALATVLVLFSYGCSSHKVRTQPVVEHNTTETNTTVERNITQPRSAPKAREIYLPTINISPEHTTYVTSTKELQNAINDAKEGDTILVKPGAYGGVYIRNKKHLTIKSEVPHKATLSSYDPQLGKAAFKIYNSSYINILGFEGINSTFFVFAPSWSSSVDHVYISNCLIHNQKAGIYSGINSHDWTVDKTKIYDISELPAWTALGYHQTLQNSQLSKINNFYFNIRGYAPLDDANKKHYPKYDKKALKNRDESSYERLSSTDWTHTAKNNIFSEAVSYCSKKSSKGAGIGFYIGNQNSKGDDKYLLPPQNVLIVNNIFYKNRGEGAIFMSKEYGFSDSSSKIIGTEIKNNVTDKKDIIIQRYTPDLALVNIHDNQVSMDEANITKAITQKELSSL